MTYYSREISCKKYPISFIQKCTVFLLLSISCLKNNQVGASGHSREEMTMSDSSRILSMGGNLDHESPVLSSSSSSSNNLRLPHHKPEKQTHYHHQILHPAVFVHSPAPSPPFFGHSRPGRHIGLGSSLSPTSLLGLGSSSSYGYASPEYGENAAASSGGWGSSSSSYSKGHYMMDERVNYSAVGLLGFLAILSLIQESGVGCNSALGLFGVLGLASYLQNVLRQMTTTVPPKGGRRKRSDSNMEKSSTDSQNSMDPDSTSVRITTLVLPMLTSVAHAKDQLIPYHCVHKPICTANKILVKELGEQGGSIGNLITSAVGNLLHPLKNKINGKMFTDKKNGDKHAILLEAGQNGRRKDGGENCDRYEYCEKLNKLPTYGLPPGGLSL